MRRESPLHRTPLWCKYLLLLAAGIASAFWRTQWLYGVPLLVLALALYAVAGQLRAFIRPLRWWWWMVPALMAYHWLVNSWQVGIAVICCIYALLSLARLLLLTTDTQVLLDGIGRAAGWVGIPRSHAEISLALFLRTLPDVLGSWRRIREAATARGLRRTPLRTATALVIAAVSRAKDTGDALAARGLPEQNR